jgi:phage terminase small subunit
VAIQRKLTAKQKEFCKEYLKDLNAYQAALRAGYAEKTAVVHSARMLGDVRIKAYLQELNHEREQRTQITQDRVLLELARIAFADPSDYVEVLEVPVIDDQPPAQVVEVKPTARVPKDKRAAIAGIKQGRSGIEVKLHDKVKALELIGKHLAMFTDKVDVSGEQTVTIKLPEQFMPKGPKGEDSD